jgi:hypothetical protein
MSSASAAAEVVLRHWAAQWRKAAPALSVSEHPDYTGRAWAKRRLDELEDDDVSDILAGTLDTIAHALGRLDPERIAELLDAGATDAARAQGGATVLPTS